MQSPFAPDRAPNGAPAFPGLHLACIMDGNGRWAQRRGRPRAAGHAAGVEAVRRVVEAAPAHGVGTLTLYAFSADNWARPAAEVGALMTLFGVALRAEVARLRDAGVRLSVIGRRDRLPGILAAAVARAEWETRRGTRLHLRLAVDYSAREALARAAHAWAAAPGEDATPDAFAAHVARATGGPAAPPVDLLLRTAGEQRLSDFLLWECAYAELLFLDALWPDVTAETVADAVAAFGRRERRFGALPARAA
ncbi:MAG TPA: polyprenyl diphosphate synthase [Rhodothermales bacterium]|nr:polyprenyl diphosphate synthase [Rhodothermales bacterium]